MFYLPTIHLYLMEAHVHNLFTSVSWRRRFASDTLQYCFKLHCPATAEKWSVILEISPRQVCVMYLLTSSIRRRLLFFLHFKVVSRSVSQISVDISGDSPETLDIEIRRSEDNLKPVEKVEFCVCCSI